MRLGKCRNSILTVLLALLLLLTSCAHVEQETPLISEEPLLAHPSRSITFTDALGYPVTVTSWDRVAALYGSFAETWVLAGGTLVGATSDAIEERGLELGEGVSIVGSVKEPNLEAIVAAKPDFVILSADTAGQVAIHDSLTRMGIPHAYYRVDRYEDYLAMLEQFCDMTGQPARYEQYGQSVDTEIQTILEQVQGQRGPEVLLIRAYSSGAKAKGTDNLAGVMLEDLGADNLVTRYSGMLEELSIEEIILADPEYIFVTIMGSGTEKAMDYMKEHFEKNPAWAGLTAVKTGQYIILPQELFHYKPNARWAQSYRYLAGILYPGVLDS